MITFIPRDIGKWRNVYHFGPELATGKPTRGYFHDKQEFICFFKEHGVKLDDVQHPLEFLGPKEHHVFGSMTYDVVQWTLLGWIKDYV
jgi:hypothetical protein